MALLFAKEIGKDYQKHMFRDLTAMGFFPATYAANNLLWIMYEDAVQLPLMSQALRWSGFGPRWISWVCFSTVHLVWSFAPLQHGHEKLCNQNLQYFIQLHCGALCLPQHSSLRQVVDDHQFISLTCFSPFSHGPCKYHSEESPASKWVTAVFTHVLGLPTRGTIAFAH